MIYVHTLGRAARYYGERIALSSGRNRLTFSELHSRVERIASNLNRRGLRTGDRLAVLTKFSGAEQFDLSSLEVLAFGGSPMPFELYRRTRRMLPGVELVHLYGTAETGLLTGLEAPEDIVGRLSCGQPCPGTDVQVVDPSSGEPVAAGQSEELLGTLLIEIVEGLLDERPTRAQ
jgi:acyl-coenzyme A synthetase/AMP-(fatty) acid ligase